MNIRFVRYALIPIPKEILNLHPRKSFQKISFAVKCHLVFITIYESQIKLKYLLLRWLILNHSGWFRHYCNELMGHKLCDISHLVRIHSKPTKRNQRYDGFCKFPVIVAKSSDPDDVKLEFQYCAPLEAESNLYRIINQEQTKLTMSLLKGKSISNWLHFRWFNT